MKTILQIIFGILLLGMVSALTLTAGESYTFDLNETYRYYSIIGNSSPVNITQEGTIVTILPDKYSQEESFEIIFFNSKEEVIVEHHHSGGGGSTKYVEKEVPIYVDKEVVKEIPSEIPEPEVVEETPKEVKLFLFILCVLLVIIGIMLLIQRAKVNKIKRGLENIFQDEKNE